MNADTTRNIVVCSNCQAPQDELPGLDVTLRSPCPKCGGLSRTQCVSVAFGLGIHSLIGIKGKRDGKGKPFIEQKIGDDLHRDSGKWKNREMLVDHENDRYKEKIVDKETGQIDREVEEPLSQHRNRGSARLRHN